MNVKSGSGFFNSRALRRRTCRPSRRGRKFIQQVRDAPDLRWGGDFNPEDPVHIDDGLNRTDPDRWQSKLNSLQRS